MNETVISNKINELKEYLRFISILYNKILATSAASEKKASKILSKEQKNFNENYRKNENSAKFYKEHRKNLKKLSATKPYDKYPIEIYQHTVNDIVKEIRQNDHFSFENVTEINKFINTLFKHFSLDINTLLNNLMDEYDFKMQKVRQLEQKLEALKAPKTKKIDPEPITTEYTQTINKPSDIISKPDTTKTEPISQTQIKEEMIENSYEIKQYDYIINGPRKRTMMDLISGYDPFFADLSHLYTFAAQIIVLICDEQKSLGIETFSSQNPEHPLYHIKSSNISEEEKAEIFKKFGVKTIDELIQKYEIIYDKFYSKFKKLSPKDKERCKCPSVIATMPKFSSIEFQHGMAKENFDFPPSKDGIIEIINKRALNIRSFRTIKPRKLHNEEITTSPADMNDYLDQRDYYRRLIKYMSSDQINLLYNNVKASYERCMREPNPLIHTENEYEANSYYAILQELFCNLIIEKKGLEFKNDEERELEKVKIVETILKEKRKFPLRYAKPEVITPTVDEEATRRIALSNQDDEIEDEAPELNNSTGMKL